jgi:hypothetical protein
MSAAKDPVRLLLDPELPEAQRAVLMQGATLEPPRGAEAAVWQGLAGALGAAAIAGAVKTPNGAASARPAGVTTTKLVVAALALGALAGMGALGRRAFAPVEKAPAPVVDRGAAPSPAGLRPSPHSEGGGAQEALPPPQPIAPAPRERGEAQGEGPAPRRQRPNTRSTTTATQPAGQESTLIEEARQALHGGDPTRALKLLEQCRRMFPAGVRAEERELLTIQALVSAVQGREARARAAAFLRKYPQSSHLSDLRALGLAPGRQ